MSCVSLRIRLSLQCSIQSRGILGGSIHFSPSAWRLLRSTFPLLQPYLIFLPWICDWGWRVWSEYVCDYCPPRTVDAPYLLRRMFPGDSLNSDCPSASLRCMHYYPTESFDSVFFLSKTVLILPAESTLSALSTYTQPLELGSRVSAHRSAVFR